MDPERTGASGESQGGGLQVLLERLASVQRAIVANRALHEVFDDILGGVHQLTGADVAILRLRDPSQDSRTFIAASQGASQAQLAGVSGEPSGITAQAIDEGRLVVSEPGGTLAQDEWGRSGLSAGIAAPVFERDTPTGALAIASTAEGQRPGPAEEQVLLAFAEHVSLALGSARALSDAAHEAFHDSLTGLPNRTLFLDRIAHSLARAERTGAPVGVLFVDLDDFKTVNDSLGHRAGDELLLAMAARLEACLRPADTIARLGGDEFAVLLEELGEPGDAARAAQRLLNATEAPFEIGGREIFIGASIGIAAGSSDGETLLRDADLAMYRAKREGKNRYETFEPTMHDEIVERMELEVDLRRAIERSELELAYQPIIDMQSGVVAGLEALVRWRHPTLGLVLPDRFVPLAEAGGRIAALGRWVLHTACHQAALWRAKYPAMPGIKIGVNVSASQLRDASFAATIAEALEVAQLDPEGLTLEITETVLMGDMDLEAAAERLAAIRELGVEIAIDDFGVGHASLRYLKRLPLDNLKVAQPFVDDIVDAESRPRILRAILELSDVFGLRAVAEGIERPEQRDVLLELGCTLGQGHLLSRPLVAQAADDFILRSGLLAGADDSVRRSESSARPASES